VICYVGYKSRVPYFTEKYYITTR